MHYTCFFSLQSITGKNMDELGYSNLGFINLAIIYLGFALSSTIAAKIESKLGSKWTCFIGSFMYALWAASFILPAQEYE